MKEGNPHNSLVMLTPPIETTKPLSERKRKKGKKGIYVSTDKYCKYKAHLEEEGGGCGCWYEWLLFNSPLQCNAIQCNTMQWNLKEKRGFYFLQSGSNGRLKIPWCDSLVAVKQAGWPPPNLPPLPLLPQTHPHSLLPSPCLPTHGFTRVFHNASLAYIIGIILS